MFTTSSRVLFFICILTLANLFAGCGFISSIGELQSVEEVKISGQIKILGSLSQSAQCASPKISLYKISSSGKKLLPAIAQTNVNNDGAYSFDVGAGFDSWPAGTRYYLEASDCHVHLSRIVTGLGSQDIDFGTTALGFAVDSTLGNHLISSEQEKIQKAMMLLSEAQSWSQVSQLIQNDAQTQNAIESIFGGQAADFLNLPPRILASEIPLQWQEKQTQNISVALFHFNPSYSAKALWRLSSADISTATATAWAPGANTQGIHTLELLVGQDSAGSLDLAKPYSTKVMNVQIANNIPPAAPTLTVQGGATTTGSLNLNLNINTGAALANCESFSSLALTEDTPVAPLLPTSYVVNCSSAPTQTLAYTLSPGDGLKILRLWARDADGNISASSQQTSILLDQTAPVLSITPSASLVRGGQSSNIAWSASDAGVGVQKVELWYSPDNTTFTLLQDITAQSSSYSWSVPSSVDLNNARIKIIAVDLLGHSSELVSSAITIDSTSPALAISSPAAMTPTQLSLTVSGTCETGLNVELAGTGISSPVSAACTGGTYSQSINLSAGEGTKSISFTQTDAAGNATTLNRNFVRDNTAPALTIAAPGDGTSANSSVTLNGACETGLAISIAGTGVLSPFSISCSGGTYSQAVFFSTGEGTKAISVSQTDAAGNSTNLSRNFVRDTTAPAITQTLHPASYATNTDSVSFGGACETGLIVSISGADTSTTTCSSGTWTYTVSTQTTDLARNYIFTQTDSAGNPGSVSASWERDTLAPALTITSTINFQTSSNSVTFSGACENGIPIIVSGSDSASQSCSGGSWSFTSNKSTDATYNYSFTQTDAATNSHSVNGSWVRNTAGPVITITSTNPILSTNNTETITGTCTDGLTIIVANAVNDTTACSTGTFSYPIPNTNTDGSRQYDFSQTDVFANTSTASATWKRDTTPPSFTNSSFVIGSGSGTVGSSYTKMSFAVTDNLTRVMSFCIQVDDSNAPAANDPCWSLMSASPPNVTPSTNVTVTNFPFLLSFDPGSHDVYLWAKDELGNISVQNSIAGRDYRSVTYTPITPPSVSAVIATNTDVPNNPPTSAQLNVTTGQDIYVKWKASGSLGSTPISISFSTDDINWSLYSANISLTAQSGCTPDHVGSSLDDGMNGCYKISSPTGGSIRIRISVKDNNDNIAMKSSGLLNTGLVQILAGNVDDGLNSSATKAMLFNRIIDQYQMDLDSFVMTNDGKFIFRDQLRGILIVKPEDGILRQLIPVTGTSIGDNGSVSAATLKRAYKIVLDHQGRLLIWDYDRIRRVDFTTNTISTIIGGGGNTSDNVANALDVSFDPFAGIEDVWDGERWSANRATLVPLPNGDIYFQTEKFYYSLLGHRFRIYSPSANPQVRSFNPHGIGNSSGNPNDISQANLMNLRLTYDLATSAVQTLSVTTVNVYGRTEFQHPSYVGDEHSFSMLDPTAYTPISTNSADHPAINGSVYCCDMAWAYRFTGMDGKLYAITKLSGRIQRYDPVSKTWPVILGNGMGNCTDGTAALSCKALIDDAFVTKNGKIFFMDNGRLRTVTSAGNIATIYGQSYTEGNGGNPLQARFGVLAEVNAATDGSLLLVDRQNMVAREVSADRTLIQHVTGNGSNDYPRTAVSATNQPFSGASERPSIAYNPTNKNLYALAYDGGRHLIAELNRVTNQWEAIAGQGTTHVKFGDGMVGSDLNGFEWGTRVAGIGGGNILVQMINGWADTGTDASRSYTYSSLKAYNLGTHVQTTLTEKQGFMPLVDGTYRTAEWGCADGTPLNNCQMPIVWWSHGPRGIYDDVGQRWLFRTNRDDTPGRRIMVVDPSVGTMQTLVTLPRLAQGLAYRRSGGQEFLYYCGQGSGLYKYNITTHTEIQMSLPTTMSCTSNYFLAVTDPVAYDSTRDKILFIFKQNGLHGVAQIDP